MELNEKMENLGSQIKSDLEKSNNELKNEIKGLQDQFDQLSAKNIDLTSKGITFQDELTTKLSATSEDVLAKGAKFVIKASLTPAGVVAPDQVPGIHGYANRKVSVRNLMSIGSTSSNAVNYVQSQSWTSFSGTTAEGTKRPESGFVLKGELAPVKTIGTFLKVSKEQLADVQGISSFITNRAPAELKIVEDKYILDLIRAKAVAFTTTTLTLGVASTPNEYDVMRVGVNMVEVGNYGATAILVHPSDKARLELTKDTQGGYLFPNGSMSVAGVPVISSNVIEEGNFLIGDFQLGAELVEREGLSINFYNQNSTDVEDGLVTIALEERIAVPIYNPASFIFGAFGTAKAKLKTA
ncbi:phage major capsid protein [Pedobacter immunditicola]|uniref:phage major capsid protein n=1 Tax=Pedobacter immunditicola TaxID=3133440 RepID=UPI0030AB4E2F